MKYNTICSCWRGSLTISEPIGANSAASATTAPSTIANSPGPRPPSQAQNSTAMNIGRNVASANNCGHENSRTTAATATASGAAA